MGHGNSDKLYITHAEWAGGLGQHSASGGAKAKTSASNFARLPFDCCALTLKPFETPVCTKDGTVYDLLSIIPYLKENGTDPVSGNPLTPAELIKLNFFKKEDSGEYYDPVTFKVFNEHTAIVAIKTSGNVFAKDTVDRLNVKAGIFTDLVSETPFTKKDIIVLQDPHNIEKRDFSQFKHIKAGKPVKKEKENDRLANINLGTTGVTQLLKEVGEKTKNASILPASLKNKQIEEEKKIINVKSSVAYNDSFTSNNRMAASFTSTSAPVEVKAQNALWHEEDLMFEAIRKNGKKAYVRLITNFGNMECELFADKAPKTVYNFIQLSREDKYKNVIFHRLIAGFMLQGGDPTGTGRGGSSYWGKDFEDEFPARNAPKHSERGTIAMANKGPATNSSQFYITFRETSHLDGKHTVFGHLVSGHETLDKIEKVPVDPMTNRPLKSVVLRDVAVFKDPYEEYRLELEKRLEKEEEFRAGKSKREKQKEERAKDRTTWFGTELSAKDSTSVPQQKEIHSGGVGKYLQLPTEVKSKKRAPEAPLAAAKKKKTGFGDFSGW